MESTNEKDILEKYLDNLCNSSKFRKLHQTISKLQKKYLSQGFKQEEIIEKITGKLFNDTRSATINWMNPTLTYDYHKIKNLGDFDSKTVEVALTINKELSRVKKRLKTPSQISSDEAFDEASDFFQYRLEQRSNEKNSTSGSNSPSELEMHLPKSDSLIKAEFLSRSVSRDDSSPPYPINGSMPIFKSNLAKRSWTKPAEEYEEWEQQKVKKVKKSTQRPHNFDLDNPLKKSNSMSAEGMGFSFKDIGEDMYQEMDPDNSAFGINRFKRSRDPNDQMSGDKDFVRIKYL